MARAYIVLARNDLDDNLLQVLDLKPNATPSKDSRVYAPIAQGGYQTFYLLDGVNAAVVTQAGAAGGASLDIDGDVYGLSAYLIDRVEDTGGGESLTAAEAVTISGLIEAAAPAGVAGSDLDGTLGASTGTVEEVLRILAGERFKMTDNAQVRLVGGGFDTAQRGFFVQQPNVEVPASVDGVYGDVRGRRSTAPMTHIRPGEPRTAPVQTGAQDTNFNRVRQTVETGHLHLSATDGVLAELKSATFTWLNPGNAYTAAAVTAATPRALTLAAANIPATGVFRAITIYDAEGNVI